MSNVVVRLILFIFFTSSNFLVFGNQVLAKNSGTDFAQKTGMKAGKKHGTKAAKKYGQKAFDKLKTKIKGQLSKKIKKATNAARSSAKLQEVVIVGASWVSFGIKYAMIQSSPVCLPINIDITDSLADIALGGIPGPPGMEPEYYFSSDLDGDAFMCSVHETAMAIASSAAFSLAYYITNAIPIVGPILAPFIAAAAYIVVDVTYMVALIAAATIAADGSDMCNPGGTNTAPAAYSDGQIMSILSKMGQKESIGNIVDKYNKICVQYAGEYTWLGNEKCSWSRGIQFCASCESSEGEDYPDYLCARVTSTCPCMAGVKRGHLKPPEYIRDKYGVIQVDNNGELMIKNKDWYKRTAARHCRVTRETHAPPLPEYRQDGIIDEVCTTWSGYSKNNITLTSGIVQCVENTIRNIFEKPIIKTSGVTNSISDDDQKITFGITKDYDNIQILIKDINLIISDIITLSIKNSSGNVGATHVMINSVKDRVDKLSNKSFFNTFDSYKKDTYTINPISMVGNDVQDIASLQGVRDSLELLSGDVKQTKESLLKGVFGENEGFMLTPFQTMQGGMKILFFMLIMFSFIIFGFRMLSGSASVTPESIGVLMASIVAVYYFAFGTGWKDIILNAVFSLSKGIGSAVIDITADREVIANAQMGCNFHKNYYIPNPGDKCSTVNPSTGSNEPAIVAYNSILKQDVIGCIKGPFIPRPNYERVHIPVFYTTIDKNGTSSEIMLPVYCYKGNSAELAIPVMDAYGANRVVNLKCAKGFTMEEGYRLTELAKMGIVDIKPIMQNDRGYINTALEVRDENGQLIRLLTDYSSKEQNDARAVKYKTARYLESLRSKHNKQARMYPVIEQYGSYRDMSYVAMFDDLDCKIMRYLGFQANGTEDYGMFKFMGSLLLAFPIGWIVAICMIVMAFLIISIAGKMVQDYVVCICTIGILLYLTPVVMPLLFFQETKRFFDQWLTKFINCLVSLPASFFVIGISIVVLDLALFGQPQNYQAINMFTADGLINEACGAGMDNSSLPLACLAGKLKSTMITKSFPLIKLTVFFGKDFWDLAFWIVIRSILAIGILIALKESLPAIESAIGLADTKLNGSVFNSSSGVFNHISSRVGATLSLPGKLSNDASQPRSGIK